MYNIGDIVVATEEAYGTYIGEVDEILEKTDQINVRIKACLRYPLQMGTIHTRSIKERQPFGKAEIITFDRNKIACHIGEVPEYEKSIIEALERALEYCANVDERYVLTKHALAIILQKWT